MKKNAAITTKVPAKKRAIDSDTIEYVIPLGGNGWLVKNSKAKKFTVITDNKRDAVSIARSIAKTKQIKLEIYGRDGNVEKTESYVA